MAEMSMEQLPAEAKDLPQGAQQIFVTAYNSASSDGMDDTAATEVAWNSVKNSYEKSADGWQRKPEGGTDTENPSGTMSGG